MDMYELELVLQEEDGPFSISVENFRTIQVQSGSKQTIDELAEIYDWIATKAIDLFDRSEVYQLIKNAGVS